MKTEAKIRHCVQCQKDIPSKGKNNNVKYCSKSCDDIFNHDKNIVKYIKANRDKYSKYAEGKFKCPFCEGYYIKLAGHTFRRHEMAARDLKDYLKLPRGTGIIPEWHKGILREHVFRNKDVVIDKNLILKGKATRAKKGNQLAVKTYPHA